VGEGGALREAGASREGKGGGEAAPATGVVGAAHAVGVGVGNGVANALGAPLPVAPPEGAAGALALAAPNKKLRVEEEQREGGALRDSLGDAEGELDGFGLSVSEGDTEGDADPEPLPLPLGEALLLGDPDALVDTLTDTVSDAEALLLGDPDALTDTLTDTAADALALMLTLTDADAEELPVVDTLPMAAARKGGGRSAARRKRKTPRSISRVKAIVR
jgi:hypothetical protein